MILCFKYIANLLINDLIFDDIFVKLSMNFFFWWCIQKLSLNDSVIVIIIPETLIQYKDFFFLICECVVIYLRLTTYNF